MGAESPRSVGLVLAVHGAQIEKVDVLSPKIIQVCHSILYLLYRENSYLVSYSMVRGLPKKGVTMKLQPRDYQSECLHIQS